MKRSIYFLFGLLMVTAMLCTLTLFGKNKGRGGDEKEAPIRYDGVYYKQGVLKAGHHQNTNYTYLRFYPDGTVLVKTSSSKPEQMARHLTKARSSEKGRYKIKKDEIYFSLREINETHSYEGVIKDKETLQMKIYTSGMDAAFEDIFQFIQVDFSGE